MTSTKFRFESFFGLLLLAVGLALSVAAQNANAQPDCDDLPPEASPPACDDDDDGGGGDDDDDAPSGNALDISDAPMFVSVGTDPNIMFTTDDSGSMTFDYMPDNPLSRQFLGLSGGNGGESGDEVAYLWPYPELGASGGFSRTYDNRTVPTFTDDIVNAYYRSPTFNSIYYDPKTEYEPWVKADGTQMEDADATKAYFDPMDTGDGNINLRTEKTNIEAYYSFEDQDLTDDPGGDPDNPPVDVDCDPTEPDGDSPDEDDCIKTSNDFWPMVYWIYDEEGTGSEWDLSNYTKVEIRNGSLYIGGAPGNIGQLNALTGADRASVAEEEQNFANWFQYYRARVLVSRGGIGKAFQSLNSGARVGFARINKGGGDVDGENHDSIVKGVRAFDADGREGFYDSLYTSPVGGGTPLRSAAVDVGEYFKRDDDKGPWSETPGEDGGGPLLACRQSYHILLTDGYYNSESLSVGNSDNIPGETISSPDGDSYVYTPGSPFSDDESNTLGDIAMEYWKQDLLDSDNGDVDNRVPTNEVDTAFWQHLTAFGVGFGVDTSSVDPDAAFAAISSGDTINWPDINFGDREDPAKIDDLLHFAVNGRGGFFSAANPVEFAQELAAILAEVVARANSTTSVAVSSTRLDAGSFVYRALFDSENWSGELIAEDVYEETVQFATDELADMGASNRAIYTFVPDNSGGGGPDGIGDGSAVEFGTGAAGAIGDRLAIGDDADSDLWNAENVISYIRGDDSLEGDGGFRERSVMLGDIINSRPVASTAGNEGWGLVDEDYLDYISGPKNDPRDCAEPATCGDYARRDTVFVGANDGMLHAFDARNLEEYFAYVPASVHGNLKHLADKNYSHKYFVDGQLAVSDAHVNGSWGTYLVGTLGAGGKGVYALNVTDPESFDETKVMWELTAEDDPDIGYTYGEPVITRLDDDAGTWVAIFGNGYNSQDLHAHLFVVKLSNGEILQKIPVGDAGSNGLSGVSALRDVNEQTHVDRIYAGDLEGTMWRFDFEDGTGSVKYDSGLYSSGRPIVSRPALTLDPSGGVLVYFGTGKLIETSDKTDPSLERFYGIRDRGESVEWSELASSESGGGVRGWYISLDASGGNGEKAFGPPRVGFGGFVTFATFEPVNDACTPGGLQRVYLRDSLTGAGGGPQVMAAARRSRRRSRSGRRVVRARTLHSPASRETMTTMMVVTRISRNRPT